MKKLTLAPLLLFALSGSAQIPVASCAIEDYSTCTANAQPTTGCVIASLYGDTVSGSYPQTVQVSDPTTSLHTTAAAHMNPWVGVTPSCASGWSNSSTLGMTLSGGWSPTAGANPADYEVWWDQNALTWSVNSSMSVPIQVNVPNSYSSNWGQVDSADILSSGGFVNFMYGNFINPGTSIEGNMEIPGPGAVFGTNPTIPSSTEFIVSEGANPNTGISYLAIWNSSGQYVAGSLAMGTTTAPGGMQGMYVGAGYSGVDFPSPYTSYYGTMMFCGVKSTETACPFPLAPGLQVMPLNFSVAPGSYASPQTVAINDLPSSASVYYTTDGSTPSCTLGTNDVISSCHGTLYTGAVTVSTTTNLQAIACQNYYQCSAVAGGTYTISSGGGVLAALRSIPWPSLAGAVPGSPGTLPDGAWTQCGAVAAYGSSGTPGNVSTINSALGACAAQTYVQLACSADYYLTGGAITPTVNQTEIRGCPDGSTRIHMYGTGGGNTASYAIALQGSNNYVNGEQNHATWTSGYSKGGTTITLSNSINLIVGDFFIVDQQNESADTGTIWNNTSSLVGASSAASGSRTDNTCTSGNPCSQEEHFQVISCAPSCNYSGSTVITVSPAIQSSNWSSSKSPGAYWATTDAYQMGAEYLSIDLTNTTGGVSGILVNNCFECFEMGNRTINGARNHVNIQFSMYTTAMLGYHYGQQSGYTGTSAYAIETQDSSYTLIASNICQQVVECAVSTGGGAGIVDAGNFAKYGISTSSALPPMIFNHGAGDQFWLSEQDIFDGVQEDNTHGTHDLFTSFRNMYPGYEGNGAGYPYSSFTTPVYIYGGSRYGNVLGNLIGQAGYHTTLDYLAAANPCTNSWTTEYVVGCGATGAAFLVTPTSVGGSTQAWDVLANNSLMAYDNYDVVSAAAHTISTASSFSDSTGSPSTLVGLASPGTLPSSLVFASAPAWWKSAGTAIAFPALGPDVTSGNLLLCTSGTYSGSYVISSGQCSGGASSSAYAGHANANPAMACALNVMGMAPDGSGSVSSYSPYACYTAGSGGSGQQLMGGGLYGGSTL